MKMIKKHILRASFLFMVVISLLIPGPGWLAPARVEAANENNPPSKIDLTGIFTTPTGSNSSIIGGNIVEITPNIANQKGGIWSTNINKMDLTKNFTASMYIYFGNQGANAGDGMAFVMHNDARGTNALGNMGSGLGVYASQDPLSSKTDGVQNSFAVEFDTYVNNSFSDSYFDTNVTKGNHVAWSYPGKVDTYIDYYVFPFNRRTMKHNNVDGNAGVQFPGLLSNDAWRKFTINWNAATSTITYQLQGESAVSVPLNVQDVFGSNQVYWGFTGSTGSKFQNNRVTFDQVPGLVEADVKETITKKDNSIVESGTSVNKGEELTYKINAKYLYGKQDWTDLILKSVLNGYVSYIPGSMTITTPTGTTPLDDSSWSGQSLAVSLPNMNANMNDVTVSFKVKANQVLQATPVTEKADFVGSNYITQTIPVDYVIQPNQTPEVTINEAGPIHLAVGEDYEIKGTWKDVDDATNTLKYNLNGQLLNQETLDNGGSTEPVEWSYLISKDVLKLGENNFQVISSDGDGASSSPASVKIIVESPPTITLTDVDKEIPLDFGTGYTISGSWSDLDSNAVDLYYVVDGGTPVKFAPSVSNSTNKGEEVNYQYTIPADQLSLGIHQITVYAVDDTSRQSNTEKLTVNVTGELNFTSVSDNVSFENVKISGQSTFSKRGNDWDIRVKDTRGIGNSWRLTATLTEDFSDGKGNYLKDALTFFDENGNESIMKLGVATNVYEHVTEDSQEVSINWQTDQGILLKVNPYVRVGDYTGEINWNLIDAP